MMERDLEMTIGVPHIPKGDKVVTFIRDFDGNLFEVVEELA